MKRSITAQSVAEGMTLIRTAIVAEFNTQRLIEFSEAGVTIIEWSATIDDSTTDICLELDGKQWWMTDDPMDFEAYVPIGHDIPFPGAVAHWNCRSTVLPVDDDGTVFALPVAMEAT